METLNCHSNETTWTTTIKTQFMYRLMSWTCMLSFSFIPIPLWLLRRRVFNKFSKIYSLCCYGNQSNSSIWTKFIWIVEDYSRNISVEKIQNICSETAKITTFHFSHYNSMETISCHSNQISYPIGTKTQLFVPSNYRCYMWNMERIGFTVSEEKSFENVDGQTTDDGCLPILLAHLRASGSGELKTDTETTHIELLDGIQ